MAFTPVEIRHVKFGRGIVGGYKRDAVNKTLAEITLSFEDVWRERADLADRVEALETELSRLREREELLKERLIAEARRVRALLRSALDIVEEAHVPVEDEQKAEQAAEPWPRHDDTREFGGAPGPHIRSA